MTDTLTPPTATSEPIVRCETANGITTLTLNRPDARNALSVALIGELHTVIDACAADPATKAIILTAAGPVFCPGHDLKEMTAARTEADGGTAFFKNTMAACADMMKAIIACPKPVIAAVQGTATAAGCQLVATCDLAVAADHATFCTPGVHIGLFCSTPMVALSRNVSRKHAMEMLLLGENVPADRAKEFGLVNRVVPANAVKDEARAMAATIASKSTPVIAIGKEAFYAQSEMSLADAYNYASLVMTENMLHADAKEGITAFVEKRDPKWSSD